MDSSISEGEGFWSPPTTKTAIGLGDSGNYRVLIALSVDWESIAFQKEFALIGWQVDVWHVQSFIPTRAFELADVILTDLSRVLESAMLALSPESRGRLVMIVNPERGAEVSGHGADAVIARPIDPWDPLGLRGT